MVLNDSIKVFAIALILIILKFFISINFIFFYKFYFKNLDKNYCNQIDLLVYCL
jgi:hypothetical protein